MLKADAALEGLRPHLQADGGNVEIVEVTDDYTLKIKWLGNCENCSMTAMTMQAGVAQAVRQQVPEIQSIEAVNGN